MEDVKKKQMVNEKRKRTAWENRDKKKGAR
jgi:hypothetical protein